jgi:four helix bundle protein
VKDNIVQIKAWFAVEIVNLYKKIVETKKEYVLSKQMLRSGTSIGSNIEEAIGGQSRNDFISKLSISYKETRETMYWLKLLRETNYIEIEDAFCMLHKCDELAKIISAIIKSSKRT